MFDVAWSELLVILLVAVILIRPDDLPGIYRTLAACFQKCQAWRKEFQTVISDLHQAVQTDDLRKEVTQLREEINYLLDESGNKHTCYDLSDLKPDFPADKQKALMKQDT